MKKLYKQVRKRLKGVKHLLLCVLLLLSFGLTITPTIAQVKPNQALTIVEEAQNQYNHQAYQQAISLWKEAISLFPENSLNQAMAYSNLSLTYQQLGEWEEAKTAINQSETILQSLKSTDAKQRIFAQTLDIKGQLQYKIGQYQQALDSWQSAANLDLPSEARINNQINQSLALSDLGFYPRACQILLEVLEQPNQECTVNPDEIELSLSIYHAKALRNLGNLLRISGNLEEAEQILQKSLVIIEENQYTTEKSKSLIMLGHIQRALANQSAAIEDRERAQTRRQEAINTYQQAASISTSTNKAQAELNQLELLIESGEWSQASRLVSTLETQISNLIPNRENIYLQINYTKNFLCLKQQDAHCLNPNSANLSNVDESDIQKSLQALEETAAIAIKLQDEQTHSYILGLLGRIYEGSQNSEAATEYTQAALYTSWQAQAPELSYQWQWQQGRILKAQNQNETAKVAYEQTINTLKSLRQEIVSISPEIQFTFRESIEPIYRDYVDLLLPVNTEVSAKNLETARETIDSLQLAELENFFRLVCLDAKPVVIDEIAEQKDPTAAIIYPILLNDRFEIILKLPQENLRRYTTLYTNPIDTRGEIEAIVERLSSLSLRQPNSLEILPVAQQLYDWLLRPIQADLADHQIKTLIFVLDSALRNVPMSILNDGNKYLVEDYDIALIPSLQLIDPQPFQTEQLIALLGGISQARDNFLPLPNVPAELEEIRQKIPEDGTNLLDETLAIDNLQEQLNQVPYSIVHLATHGKFSSQPEETFVLIWDQRLNADDINNLLSSRINDLGGIELLVLSACETLEGDSRASLGLAGVAIRAGARSTLATLWQINDQTTSIFMNEFYSALLDPTLSKAGALSRAQRKLLHNPNYQSPYYWAPYVLVGNWL